MIETHKLSGRAPDDRRFYLLGGGEAGYVTFYVMNIKDEKWNK
jgi:hypothetical protein